MLTSLRSRVGVPLGLGLGCLALVICAAPWVPAARKALGISGIWLVEYDLRNRRILQSTKVAPQVLPPECPEPPGAG